MKKNILILSLFVLPLFLFVHSCVNNLANPIEPAIAVVSPGADTTWVAGAAYALCWTHSKTSGGSVTITLANDSGTVAVIAAAAPNNGVYFWKIPYQMPNGSRYYITIADTAADSISGRSGYFSIVNYSDAYEPDDAAARATPITTAGTAQFHTLPYHDTDWYRFAAVAGQTYCIETHGSSDTYIQLFGTDTVTSILNDDNSGTGNNALIIWQCTQSGDYFFKITGTAAAGAAPYAVDVRAGGGILAIVNPDSGQADSGGSGLRIAWMHSPNSGAYVTLAVYRSDTLVATIASVASNNGIYNWPISYKLQTSAHYRIKITSTSDTSINNFSDEFTITNVPTQLTITTPSSDSRWNTGSAYTIYWTYSGYPDPYVRCVLYDSASPVATIAGSTSTYNDYCTWTIPVTLATGNYRVKITCLTDTTIYSYSNFFSITNIPQSISITAPGVQDTWQAGTTHPIVWSSAGPVGASVAISLYNDTNFVRSIGINVAIGYNYYWSLPLTIAGSSRYRIKIVSNDFPSVSCFSDFFTVLPAPDSLTIIRPTAVSSWNSGSSYAVSWSYSGPLGPSVSIELYDSSAFVQTIAPAASIVSGAYTWLVPSTLPSSSHYRIRIVGADGADTLRDTSSFFTITHVAATITVTSPLSADNWTAGSSHFISWGTSGAVPGSFVDLYLYDSTARLTMIDSGTSNAGSYLWTIPVTFKGGGGNYRIKIVCTADTAIAGYSSTFSIVSQPNRLTITSPAADSSWMAGEYYTIYWSYSGPDIPGTYARLDLYDSTTAVAPLSSSWYATNHSFMWLIPSSLQPGNRYRIKISSITLDTVYDLSGYFTITNTALTGDPYEPDSTPALATAIAKGDPAQNHTLSSETDEDWYKFNAVSGTTYTIETQGSLDTYLDLFSTDGASLLADDDDISGTDLNARITWTCTLSGAYYFRVSSGVGDIGSYSVTIR